MLTPGSHLGTYEIHSLIGEGGMGQVYRAHDSRLKRDVALKLLPSTFAADPDRVARFEREAQVLASLNHPHIAQIHGVEESNGTRALVMELVEGSTLAERIAQRPFALDECLPIARQVAQALEAAHEAGIVHRDLKPANIMLRHDGTVKVLDFGLAKATESQGAAVSAVHALTVTSPAVMTHAGVILGTAAYMAPEQARGRALDRRADIWAFGCVLYEMLSGRRAFHGADVADTLASILRSQPDYTALPPEADDLRDLIARCLEKDATARLGHMAVVRFLLERSERTRAGNSSSPRRHYLALAPVLLAVGALVIAFVVPRLSGSDVSDAIVPLERVSLLLPPQVNTTGHTPLALSHDGSMVVFVGAPLGRATPTNLYLRHRDRLDAEVVVGAEDGNDPILDPAGNWIAYYAKGTLRKVPLAGGASVTLCEATHLHGSTWSSAGHIYFAPNQGQDGIWSVPEGGGTPVQVTSVDRTNEGAHEYPTVLPDGSGLIFNALPPDGDHARSRIVLHDLATRRTHVLVENGFAPRLSRDHLLFARGNALFAGRFDPNERQVVGQIVRLADQVLTNSENGIVHYAAASNADVMVYQAGADIAARTVMLTNRDGVDRQVFTLSQGFDEVDLAPDGTRVAALVNVSTIGPTQIWTGDAKRSVLSRLMTPGERLISIRWAPDGQRFAFAVLGSGEVRVADLAGKADTIVRTGVLTRVASWSPDSNALFLTVTRPKTATDVAVVDLRTKTTTMLLESDAAESSAQLSPDGRWLAYTTNRSARAEIEVRPFRRQGAPIQVSTHGGSNPRWSVDGTTLFFSDPVGNIMRVGFIGPSAESAERVVPTNGTRRPFAPTAEGTFWRIADPTDTSKEPLISVRGFSQLLLPPNGRSGR